MYESRDYHVSEVSQKEKEKYHIISHVESEIWPKWTYVQNRQAPRHTEETCGCQGVGVEGGMAWEFGTADGD